LNGSSLSVVPVSVVVLPVLTIVLIAIPLIVVTVPLIVITVPLIILITIASFVHKISPFNILYLYYSLLHGNNILENKSLIRLLLRHSDAFYIHLPPIRV
jgi:hypothetical protein